MTIRSRLRSIPWLRRLVRTVKRRLRPSSAFTSSGAYWEGRYQAGGNSGAGSYNRLAEFKAEFLNAFVADNHVASVIEFGSGDGAQLELARYPQYVGVDVSRRVLELTRSRFAHDDSKQFIHLSEVPASLRADLALSLDVIYHLVEDHVFEDHMTLLFGSANRFVVVYSSNSDSKWEVGSHVRHRRFTDWVKANRPDFALHSVIDNPYPHSDREPDITSFADFYVFEKVGALD